eukprot:m.225244 g.225244  ORF g.225244 m.225244 type:complete len:124 (+) comp40012_c0_seq14:589-960(+)
MSVPEWALGLRRSGLYFEGFVDNLEVFEGHKAATLTTYGTRSSRQVIHAEGSENNEPSSENCSSNDKLFWSTNLVNFGGVPFTIDEVRLQDCQFGIHYYNATYYYLMLLTRQRSTNCRYFSYV